MTTANCGATDEFDFRLIFGEDGQPGPGPPLGPAGAPRGRGFGRVPVFLRTRRGGRRGLSRPRRCGRRQPGGSGAVRPSLRPRPLPGAAPVPPAGRGGSGAIGRASPRRNNFLWEKKPKSSHRAGGAAPGAVAPAGKRPRVGSGGPTTPEPGERDGAGEGQGREQQSVNGAGAEQCSGTCEEKFQPECSPYIEHPCDSSVLYRLCVRIHGRTCRDVMALWVRVYRCTHSSQSASILLCFVAQGPENPVLKCWYFSKLQKTKYSL